MLRLTLVMERLDEQKGGVQSQSLQVGMKPGQPLVAVRPIYSICLRGSGSVHGFSKRGRCRGIVLARLLPRQNVLQD